jgi:hypothetical protein
MSPGGPGEGQDDVLRFFHFLPNRTGPTGISNFKVSIVFHFQPKHTGFLIKAPTAPDSYADACHSQNVSICVYFFQARPPYLQKKLILILKLEQNLKLTTEFSVSTDPGSASVLQLTLFSNWLDHFGKARITPPPPATHSQGLYHLVKYM